MITRSDILHGKILIVDDQQANILLLERMLKTAGYVSISSTQDPGKVCALYVENRYDLIMLDLHMPGMNGFEVMEALKKVEKNGYLPVLVVTAQPGHKQQALEAGAKDFISKPFELAEVLARVYNMLEVRLLHKKSRQDNEKLERQVFEQTTLLTISHTLASSLELNPGLILTQLHGIITYAHGGLFALKGAALVALAMRGTQQPQQSLPVEIPMNISAGMDELFTAHQPVRIANVWSDDDLQAQFLRSLPNGLAVILLKDMMSWLWVPMTVRERLMGGIFMAHQQQDYFTSHQAALVLSVANQAAITMLNMELNEQAQVVAILDERQRLARDLHDAVNQSLFSAKLIAEALPRLWDIDQQDARRSLQDLRVLIDGASAEMRAILTELRPSTLTESKLSDLLRLQGNAFSGRTNVPVVFTVTKEFSLPDKVQVAFYRVSQEILNNIAKHANAHHVEIDIKQTRESIELRIHDDGQGFDPQRSVPGHYGMGMMNERADSVGAVLSVNSQPGLGTGMKICWTATPLAEAV